MSERADVVVVGSGAGGGLIASELAQRGRRVVLLEAGPHRTASDFLRFEARTSRELYWPVDFAATGEQRGPQVAMVSGRCVGGSTTINGSVALHATEEDVAKWADATAPRNPDGTPLTLADLAEDYAAVEHAMHVRVRDDWCASTRNVARGFEAVGARLEPLSAYTDHSCMGCGSCLGGCPTNAGKSTMVCYVHPALATGNLDLRPGCEATRLLLEPGERRTLRASGVEYRDADGAARTVEADAVVVACGALRTPLLLLRSGLPELTGHSPSSRQIGRHLGVHLGRHVYARYDEPQDLHRAFATSAACFERLRDADGGFLVYVAGMMDPIALAMNLVDEQMRPLWGERLASFMRAYRNLAGIIVMINDENTGSVSLGEDGQARYEFPICDVDHDRLEAGMAFVRQVAEAAGARESYETGYLTAHVQSSCRMGSDPARSVVDSDGEAHDVERLFVGDASAVPRTLSVGPSLTIMALARRLARHLDADPHGYLAAPRVDVAA